MRRPYGPSMPAGSPSSRSCDSEQLNRVRDQIASGDRPVAELLEYGHPDPAANGSDHRNFISQAVELAKTLTGASGSAIAFRGEQGTICQARSGEGAPPLGAPVDASAGISKYCLDSGRALRCDDIATDGRVDPEISRAGGIRAVAIVPIYTDGEICGILEVFSGTPGIFTGQHLEILQQLANQVGAAAKRPSEEPFGGPHADAQPKDYRDVNLLVEVDPAYRALVRALDDLLSRRSHAPSGGSSDEVQVWNDVFVDSYIPWKQFLGSVLLHVVVVGMVAGLSQIWPRELNVSPYPLRAAHITYYPVSQSFPAHASSRAPVRTKPQHAAAQKQVLRVAREHQPVTPSDIRANDAGKKQALTSPPTRISSLQKPALPAATSVLPPPPPTNEATARQPHLPSSLVVAPPPDLGGASGLKRTNALSTAVVPPSPDIRDSMTRGGGTMNSDLRVGASGGTAAISIVPPPPSIGDRAVLTSRAAGVGSQPGVGGVAPPPSVPRGGQTGGRATGISLGNGLSQAVPPPPSLESAGNSGGGGKANSQAGLGFQVVPPAQSMQNGGNYGAGGRTNSLAGTGSQVVPPPPSMDGTGNSGSGSRAGSLAGTDAVGALHPGSANGASNSETGGENVAKDATIASVPESGGGDQKHPIPQDVQLRVIALAWAPPSTSYFSNFEVFIAEKSLSRAESQVIKLVYVFLPYQRRLSEFGTDNLKVRKLRVTRDPSCDESLMAMTWPEGENGPAGSHREAPASAAPHPNDALPCYRTTADDYRRAVSGNR